MNFPLMFEQFLVAVSLVGALGLIALSFYFRNKLVMVVAGLFLIQRIAFGVIHDLFLTLLTSAILTPVMLYLAHHYMLLNKKQKEAMALGDRRGADNPDGVKKNGKGILWTILILTGFSVLLLIVIFELLTGRIITPGAQAPSNSPTPVVQPSSTVQVVVPSNNSSGGSGAASRPSTGTIQTVQGARGADGVNGQPATNPDPTAVDVLGNTVDDLLRR